MVGDGKDSSKAKGGVAASAPRKPVGKAKAVPPVKSSGASGKLQLPSVPSFEDIKNNLKLPF